MRKVISAFLLLTISLLTFSACGEEKNNIEDYTWSMRSVVSIENDQYIIEALESSDTAHPQAKIVDMTLTAKDGKIAITDSTNNKAYEGTYVIESKSSEGTIYKVTIDGKDGYATVAMTKYEDGNEEPTMPINLGEYSIYFYAE